jgi:pyruvate ferredoxin oxidoreductase alpha subunit
MVPQIPYIANGNDAVAKAIIDIGYDGEGYYPITPSSDAGEEVSKAVAAGKADLSFVIGTSELSAASICTGMAVAGGRTVDITSANGLLLKMEQLPAVSGMGLPMVLNLSTREVSGPLNIKNGHSDLAAALGVGWLIFMAPTVQATYDMNIIALRVAEAVSLPAIVAYDGFHTSHGVRRINVFKDDQAVRDFIGVKPDIPNVLDLEHPKTIGPYMNDDLINTKVVLDDKMAKAYEILPSIFKEFAELSGRTYGMLDIHGDDEAEVALVALNTAGESAKVSVDDMTADGKKVKVVTPMVLRPYPEAELVESVKDCRTIVIAERVSQYGAGNYLANEMGASLQKIGNNAKILSRIYGIGGLNFTPEDGEHMFDVALNYPDVDDDEKSIRKYHGAWPGDVDYKPADTIKPLTVEETTLNAGLDKVNMRKLAEMPSRIEKHSACPGCGIFTNLNLFLRGIDGRVVLIFNTGCGMVVTTGYPLTSFKVPYFHNLFHNGSSSATGIVEMYKRFKAQGKIKEEITFVVVSGDGGDDIGMDQVIGAALRNDPFIMLEYDNKGYMNTGGQMCYTGFKGQKNSNAHVGPGQRGKKTHHKDIIQILKGTNCSYLFSAAESNARDMIAKARKAQATVRAGGFAFGKVFSVCPLNWGADESKGPEIVKTVVNACMHPLYEIENGVTTLSYDPEARDKKVPVGDAFKIMGRAFTHMLKPNMEDLLVDVQDEVDNRWARLKATSEAENL